MLQVVTVTLGYDSMLTIECDPNIFHTTLPDTWSGANTCRMLPANEVLLVEWHCVTLAKQLAVYVNVLASWSGLMVLITLLAFYEAGEAVTNRQTTVGNLVVGLNACAWHIFIMYFQSHSDRCKVLESSLVTSLLFGILSQSIVVAELFIPNTPSAVTEVKHGSTHTVDVQLSRSKPTGTEAPLPSGRVQPVYSLDASSTVSAFGNTRDSKSGPNRQSQPAHRDAQMVMGDLESPTPVRGTAARKSAVGWHV